jgi:beta-lactamase superfamily II metal-dependent hydrolase
MKYEQVCRNAFKKYSAVKIKAHDGMKFDMSGVVFEVLHTPDDDMPTIYELMNDTSLVIKMTYKDSATLWLGDMGVIPGDSCIEMYGDYLQCNAVQVSHHGWGSASWEFFKLLNPEVLLWNNSEFGFQYADKYQGYGKTESSTKLFNMPCVKKNYFCNTIKMQYIDLPFDIKTEETYDVKSGLLVSAASDRIFMLKKSDGSLIMVNAGWRKEMWERQDKDKLMQNLFSEMQKFAGKDTVTVAAWILTDSDYYNSQFLNHLNEYDFKEKIIIENIVCNFDIAPEIQKLVCNHITPKNGESIDFGTANIKTLYTGDASTVVAITLNGKKIIFTGNMTDRVSEEILASGEDISCDIVQVANRGFNNGGVLEFYSKCKAKINIWNTSEYAYRFFSPTEGYEKSEVSTKVYNFDFCEKNYFCDRILPQIIPF